MYNKLLDSFDSKTFAIYADYSSKEILDVESAFNSNNIPLFCVLKENSGKTKSHFNDDYFVHSRYTFVDKNSTETHININNWKLLKVSEPVGRHRISLYKVSDPLGEIREISNLDLNKSIWTEYFLIEGLCNFLKYLSQISKYPDWTYYDLNKKNEILTDEIDKLKQEVISLKENNQDIYDD
tara:strand:+ start:145 stop:690 length:546 start_codon:yes stop_codon:yes gene_type:complete